MADEIITKETHPTYTFKCLACGNELNQERLRGQQYDYPYSSGYHFCIDCASISRDIGNIIKESVFSSGFWLKTYYEGSKTMSNYDIIKKAVNDHYAIYTWKRPKNIPVNQAG